MTTYICTYGDYETSWDIPRNCLRKHCTECAYLGLQYSNQIPLQLCWETVQQLGENEFHIIFLAFLGIFRTCRILFLSVSPLEEEKKSFKNYLRKGCYIINTKPQDLWRDLAPESTKLYFTRTMILTWFACVLSFPKVKGFYVGHIAGLFIT